MNHARLIVLSGDAGAGKDSVANILVDSHGWRAYSLAAPLKRFASDMFGFTDMQLYGPSSARNAPDPRWARPCPRCCSSGLRLADRGPIIPSNRVECEDCEGKGKLNDNSPRRILQLMGEEFLRQMIHVDALTMRAAPDLAKLLEQGHSVVVNDARNDNDRNNLFYWLNAARVDVRTYKKRNANAKKDAWRLHASEQRKAKDDEVEYILYNNEEWPFPSLGDRVATMLKELYG